MVTTCNTETSLQRVAKLIKIFHILNVPSPLRETPIPSLTSLLLAQTDETAAICYEISCDR